MNWLDEVHQAKEIKVKIIGIQFIADKASIITLQGKTIEFASCSIENNLPINASEEHEALGNSVCARDRVRVELCLTRPGRAPCSLEKHRSCGAVGA